MMGTTGRLWLAGAWMALVLGCGGEESGPAGAGAPAAPAETAAPAPAGDPGMVLQEMYEWDATAGPPRDLATDSAACQSEGTTPGLAGVSQHIQCMQKKGWKTRQPS
jgi:hypothetical protein